MENLTSLVLMASVPAASSSLVVERHQAKTTVTLFKDQLQVKIDSNIVSGRYLAYLAFRNSFASCKSSLFVQMLQSQRPKSAENQELATF